MLKVNEIYYSIQGESTAAGLPCVFIRLTYCNLRCTYCDTEYAFYDGKDMAISAIINEVKKFECKLVEITGGEPLVQVEECLDLMKQLGDERFKVLIETGGSLPINLCVIRKQFPKTIVYLSVFIDIRCDSLINGINN